VPEAKLGGTRHNPIGGTRPRRRASIPRGLSRLRCDIMSTDSALHQSRPGAGFDAVGAPARERLILCMMMRLGQRARGAAAMNGISARSSKPSMSIFQVSARATPAAIPCVSCRGTIVTGVKTQLDAVNTIMRLAEHSSLRGMSKLPAQYPLLDCPSDKGRRPSHACRPSRRANRQRYTQAYSTCWYHLSSVPFTTGKVAPRQASPESLLGLAMKTIILWG
jgi:hypothetical protein